MTDLRALHEAFAELERRADAAAALRPERPQKARLRLMPVVATMAAVVTLVLGAVLLVPGEKPAGGYDTAATNPQPSTSMTPDDLANRFRTVLANTATFTVTERAPGAVLTTDPESPPVEVGASISGTLTASGLTGGFQLTIVPTTEDPTDKPICDGVVGMSTCELSRLADGSWLRTSTVRLEGPPNGLTNMIHRYRPDGVEIALYVSNQRSPKGDGVELGPHPPLTLAQMTTILTSGGW